MLYALFAMTLLIVAIGVLAVTTRVKAVRSKQVHVKAFRVMDGDFPESVVRTTRLYNNQFELPVLFFVAGVLYIALGQNHVLGAGLAWAFVTSRIVHAGIQLMHNNVLHRMLAFWVGVIIVIAMWASVLFYA